MKKYIYVLIIFVFCVGLFTYYNRPLKEIKIQASYHSFENIEDLIEFSDLIIIGKMERDFSDYKPTLKYNEHGRYSDFYTITDIKVNKIIKGNYLEKIIPVIQPAAIIEDEANFSLTHKKMLICDGYTLMQKNKDYIIFLKESELTGVHSLIGLQGKFNIDDLDLKEKELEKINASFKNFKKDILAKFDDKIK